jgi:hypothetical protein
MARRCMRCVGGGGDGGHGDGLGQACRVTATLIPRAHDGGTQVVAEMRSAAAVGLGWGVLCACR